MAIDWKAVRRQKLLHLLGELPEMENEVRAEVISIEQHEHYDVETLQLHLNGIEPAQAFMVHPKNRHSKTPVILFNHSHGGIYNIGKDEIFRDKGYLQKPHYAQFLTSLGYSVLSFDAWGFGARATQSEGAIFKQMLMKGQVMWGMMVYDSMRALDYLQQRDDVHSTRLGTMGISMGGLMSWWLAALDERVQFCIDLCSLADYEALIDARSLERHGIYFYVPNIMKHFTVGEINSLISPRPHLAFAGKHDDLVPLDGLARIDEVTAQVYAADGARHAWRLAVHDCGHEETPAMREDIAAFLADWRDAAGA